MDETVLEEGERQTERMIQSPRQRHALLAQSQGAIEMTKIREAAGRMCVGGGATVEPHGVREGRMRAGIVERDGLLEMLETLREMALIGQRGAEGDVPQEEVERLAGALGGGQGLVPDLDRGRPGGRVPAPR